MKIKAKLWIGLVGIIAIGWIGYWWTHRDDGTGLVTERVARGDVSETVSVTGELVPTEYVDLAFQVSGLVDHVSVREGEAVRAGAVLATLDRSVLQAELNQARAELAVGEANERLARRTWDELKPEERTARKLATQALRETVQGLIVQFERSVIRAPFDGVVTVVTVKTGETATAGQTLIRLAGNNRFVIEARVPESDIAKLAPGMEAEVTFDAFSSDEIFGARVERIDASATVVQDVVSYVTTFTPATTDPRWRDGMTADVDILSSKRENVLILPFRALSIEGGKTSVERLKPDGTTERVEVKTGLEGDAGTVEILSGIQEGDTVVITTASN